MGLFDNRFASKNAAMSRAFSIDSQYRPRTCRPQDGYL